MPHAAFYVVQQLMRDGQIEVDSEFQCRTQHFMWCNSVVTREYMTDFVSMPHAAFYVVQLRRSQPLSRAGREGVLESRRFFVPFSPYGAAFSPKNHGVNRRLPLCGAGLRQNGKSRR